MRLYRGPTLKRAITAAEYHAAWDSGDALSGDVSPLDRPRRAIVVSQRRAGVQYAAVVGRPSGAVHVSVPAASRCSERLRNVGLRQ